MPIKKRLKWSLAIICFISLAVLYKTYNPIESSFFPKCPFLVLTGYQCPGCGSQRAVHHLLNLEVASAARENFLLVLSIPYILIGVIFDFLKQPSDNILKWRKRIFGTKAILVVLIFVIGFWILRNIFLW